MLLYKNGGSNFFSMIYDLSGLRHNFLNVIKPLREIVVTIKV